MTIASLPLLIHTVEIPPFGLNSTKRLLRHGRWYSMGMETGKKLFCQIYDLVRSIPLGSVTTYGSIAKALNLKDVRRVGHALHSLGNPSVLEKYLVSCEAGLRMVPCHRVVTKDGRLAPHYAFGGSGVQHDKLASEGITFTSSMYVDLEKHLWKPAPILLK